MLYSKHLNHYHFSILKIIKIVYINKKNMYKNKWKIKIILITEILINFILFYLDIKRKNNFYKYFYIIKI